MTLPTTPEGIIDHHALTERPPQATVTQVGRWRYRVDLVHGMLSEYSGYWWGRQRAERAAQRKLARYVRREASRARWRAERTVFPRGDEGVDPANDGTVH